MVEPLQHLQHRPRQLQRPIDRLIRIRVRPERQRPHHIARLAQLLLQQLRHIGLEQQLGLEIEPRRIPEIGMARPGVAIHTAMLAPAIRIDRPVEPQVRALVIRNHAPARIAYQRRRQRRQIGQIRRQRRPPVIERRRLLALEPVRRIDRRPPPLARAGLDRALAHRRHRHRRNRQPRPDRQRLARPRHHRRHIIVITLDRLDFPHQLAPPLIGCAVVAKPGSAALEIRVPHGAFSIRSVPTVARATRQVKNIMGTSFAFPPVTAGPRRWIMSNNNHPP